MEKEEVGEEGRPGWSLPNEPIWSHPARLLHQLAKGGYHSEEVKAIPQGSHPEETYSNTDMGVEKTETIRVSSRLRSRGVDR